MLSLDTILSEMASLKLLLRDATSLAQGASRFTERWNALGRALLEGEYQALIEQEEAKHTGSRQFRPAHYHTMLGTIHLKRRAYDTPEGSLVAADIALGLPRDAWLPEILELACALGVSSEFPNTERLFTRVTGVLVTERTLANQVEAAGADLQEQEFAKTPLETAGPDSALTKLVAFKREKPVVYVELDGILVPANAGQGYKEALVGVVFRQNDHRELSPKRSEIRRRDYIATLLRRKEFGARLAQLHSELVGLEPHDVVVLADGARWIWELVAELFPGCTQILDFFHVSEYVWAVARACLPEDERKTWVEEQQMRLKQSQWEEVREAAHALPKKTSEEKEAVRALRRYLKNNAARIDYKRYLDTGLMIGSGVIESSNRRVVAQRLKQAGMHWSLAGADAVMGLRAAYLSDSDRWADFWAADTARAA